MAVPDSMSASPQERDVVTLHQPDQPDRSEITLHDRVEMTVRSKPRRGTVLGVHGLSYWILFDDARPVIVGQPDTVPTETWFRHMLTKVDA